MTDPRWCDGWSVATVKAGAPFKAVPCPEGFAPAGLWRPIGVLVQQDGQGVVVYARPFIHRAKWCRRAALSLGLIAL